MTTMPDGWARIAGHDGVFERATKSVVFIANTAINETRSFISLKPRRVGSDSSGTSRSHCHQFHVVYGANSVTSRSVGRAQGHAHRCRSRSQMAVLQIRAPDEVLSPLTVGTSQGLARRTKVLAIGIRSAWIIR